MTELIGWLSSVILLATLVKQVYKQWTEGTSEGVSKWLFIGQVASSIGFTIYSYMVGNWVFTVTNAVLLINNVFGVIAYFYFKRNPRQRPHTANTST